MFIAEVPEDQPTGMEVVLAVAPDGPGELDLIVEVVSPMVASHWGTRTMTVRDPDGRTWTLQAPGATAP